jgi:hypothetical protein
MLCTLPKLLIATKSTSFIFGCFCFQASSSNPSGAGIRKSRRTILGAGNRDRSEYLPVPARYASASFPDRTVNIGFLIRAAEKALSKKKISVGESSAMRTGSPSADEFRPDSQSAMRRSSQSAFSLLISSLKMKPLLAQATPPVSIVQCPHLQANTNDMNPVVAGTGKKPSCMTGASA